MNPANATHARIEAEAARLFQPEYGHFIDGRWLPGETGRTIDVLNPATGRVLSRVLPHTRNSPACLGRVSTGLK